MSSVLDDDDFKYFIACFIIMLAYLLPCFITVFRFRTLIDKVFKINIAIYFLFLLLKQGIWTGLYLHIGDE